jgi:hypothetical protein
MNVNKERLWVKLPKPYLVLNPHNFNSKIYTLIELCK